MPTATTLAIWLRVDSTAAGCDGLKDIPINFCGRHQVSLRLVVVFVVIFVFWGIPVNGIEHFDARAEDLIKQLQFFGIAICADWANPFRLPGQCPSCV